MRVMNRLRDPGVIRSIGLSEDMVRVTTDREVLVYRRVESDVHVDSKEPLRRGTLHKRL